MEKGWISLAERMPETMKDVLFRTKGGFLYKGCVNLKGTWTIQNCSGLIGRYVKDDSMITGWMPLPGKYDPDWIEPVDRKPDPDTYVLSLDRIDGEVYLVYAGEGYRTIRNSPSDHIIYSHRTDYPWMPIPGMDAA